MYIGMPFKWNESIPAFGCFIGRDALINGWSIDFFMFRRKDPPEDEHIHRFTFKVMWGQKQIMYDRNFWPSFMLRTIPAWRDEPTALAHYKDKGQRWHG